MLHDSSSRLPLLLTFAAKTRLKSPFTAGLAIVAIIMATMGFWSGAASGQSFANCEGANCTTNFGSGSGPDCDDFKCRDCYIDFNVDDDDRCEGLCCQHESCFGSGDCTNPQNGKDIYRCTGATVCLTYQCDTSGCSGCGP